MNKSDPNGHLHTDGNIGDTDAYGDGGSDGGDGTTSTSTDSPSLNADTGQLSPTNTSNSRKMEIEREQRTQVANKALEDKVPGLSVMTESGYDVHKLGGGPRIGSQKRGEIIDGIVNRGGKFSTLNAAKRTGEVPHHMPQNKFNKIQGRSRGSGPAVGITKRDHTKTRSFGGRGVRSMKEDKRLGLDARGRLAKDTKDLRSNFGRKYNRGSLEAIGYAKTLPVYRNPRRK